MSYAKGKKKLEVFRVGSYWNWHVRVYEADKKGDKNNFGKNKIVKKCFIDKYFTFFVVIN